jgi:hypothetical protein
MGKQRSPHDKQGYLDNRSLCDHGPLPKQTTKQMRKQGFPPKNEDISTFLLFCWGFYEYKAKNNR